MNVAMHSVWQSSVFIKISKYRQHTPGLILLLKCKCFVHSITAKWETLLNHYSANKHNVSMALLFRSVNLNDCRLKHFSKPTGPFLFWQSSIMAIWSCQATDSEVYSTLQQSKWSFGFQLNFLQSFEFRSWKNKQRETTSTEMPQKISEDRANAPPLSK